MLAGLQNDQKFFSFFLVFGGGWDIGGKPLHISYWFSAILIYQYEMI